jgi:L-amino acid N-acyltransferase YncA
MARAIPTEYVDISLAPLSAEDWPAVRAIYVEGIATGNATFEKAAPEWSRWDEGHLHVCRLVARVADAVVGWAALTPYSRREVYAGVAEVSVYVSERARGQGVGTALLSRLVKDSEREGIWTLQAGIFPENTASIELHQRAGFRVVGIREKIGSMDGRWRDVVLMERRATTP